MPKLFPQRDRENCLLNNCHTLIPEHWGGYICTPDLTRQRFWVVLIIFDPQPRKCEPSPHSRNANKCHIPFHIIFLYYPQMKFSHWKHFLNVAVKQKILHTWMKTYIVGDFPIVAHVHHHFLIPAFSESDHLSNTRTPLRSQHWENVEIDLPKSRIFLPFQLSHVYNYSNRIETQGYN